MNSQRSSPSILLLVALAFQGASGLLGGFMLMKDPTGSAIQLPLEWLSESPFETYFIPGLILFSILGLFPIATFGAVILKKSWAWYASVMVGIALVVWIGVEILIIGYHAEPPLQAIYGSLGVIILVLTSFKSVKNKSRSIE